MNKNLQEQIYGKFPEIFKEHSLPLSQSCMAYGLCVEDGWADLLIELCEDLQKMMYEGNFVVVAKQIKQKFGFFRMYYDIEPLSSDGFDKTYWFTKVGLRIQETSFKSENICEFCGKEGTKRGEFYVFIACDEHKDSIEP